MNGCNSILCKKAKKETRINEGGRLILVSFLKKKIFEKVLSAFTSNTINLNCDEFVFK